jgi:hypothetical protein
VTALSTTPSTAADADKEFAAAAREAAREINMQAMVVMATKLANPDCDPELAVKFFNATKDVAGAVPDKKADPFANLPVFHIHFNNGRVSGDITPPLQVLDMNEAFSLEFAAPSVEMAKLATINRDLLEQLEGNE